MQTEKLYHKCGYPVLVVKKAVGPVMQTFFVDGNEPFIEEKNGQKRPKVISQCPSCGGTVKMERLLSKKPDVEEDRRPSGYIPAKI
jgi:hypothetical protein